MFHSNQRAVWISKHFAKSKVVYGEKLFSQPSKGRDSVKYFFVDESAILGAFCVCTMVKRFCQKNGKLLPQLLAQFLVPFKLRCILCINNRLTNVHNCVRRRSNLTQKLADIGKIYNEPGCNQQTCTPKSLLHFGSLFTLTTAHIIAPNVKRFRYATSVNDESPRSTKYFVEHATLV